MVRVTIYSTPACRYCALAKRLLEQHAIEYDEIDVGGSEHLEEMIERAGGQKTVPQIFIDGKHVGGYVELQKLAQAGGLTALAGC